MSAFFRYADDPDIEKSLEFDSSIQREFLRQRAFLEKSKQRSLQTTEDSKVSKKLLHENRFLMHELDDALAKLKVLERKSAR